MQSAIRLSYIWRRALTFTTAKDTRCCGLAVRPAAPPAVIRHTTEANESCPQCQKAHCHSMECPYASRHCLSSYHVSEDKLHDRHVR
eukprot:6213929-Pleurochrysis_carterae.AAC.1